MVKKLLLNLSLDAIKTVVVNITATKCRGIKLINNKIIDIMHKSIFKYYIGSILKTTLF